MRLFHVLFADDRPVDEKQLEKDAAWSANGDSALVSWVSERDCGVKTGKPRCT